MRLWRRWAKAAADADPSMNTRGKRRDRGRAWNDRRRAGGASGVASIARAARSSQGAVVGRAVAVSLQELRAHLQCVDQDTDGASAQEQKWLDHARAMIEGKSLAKTAQLCGVHPTTAFRWRDRFLRQPSNDKPRRLSGIAEADETLIFLNLFQARWSDLPRKARKLGRARHAGLYPGQHSRSSVAR